MKILLKILRHSFFSIFGLLLLIGIAGLFYLESKLPSVDMLKEMRLEVPLRIFSEDGKLIGEFGQERRTPISLHKVPKNLINAVLATEDSRFYQHPGVDFKGLLRASVILLTNSSMKQGGSTITMQVARNFFLSRKKTFSRKLSEILLALKIEKELSKDEILELYLNKVYFGKRAYGIAAAAEVYYGTTVDKLSLDQIAMLAGLPQAPSNINPLHDPKAAFKRRKHVLERMQTLGFITKAEYETAVDAPLPTKNHGRAIDAEAPYVVEMVRQDLYARYGEAIYSLGYEVYTTINSQQQVAAAKAVKKALLEYDQRHGYRKTKIQLKLSRNKSIEEELENWTNELKEIPSYGSLLPGAVMKVGASTVSVLLQDGRYIEIPWAGLSWARAQLSGGRIGHLPKKPADVVAVGDVIYTEEVPETESWKMSQVPEVGGALVALDPKTGGILALVGGFDYSLSTFNRATQAQRQPGSNFKPFVYAAALAEGYTLASVVNDEPIVYKDPVTGVVWQPKNDKGKFYGPTRLRVSLSRSQNMVSVRLLQSIGMPKFIDFAEKFGFKREKLPPFLSVALGAAETTPIEIAAGYCAFANGGDRVTPFLITKITDYQGNLIYEAPPPEVVNAIDPKVAFLITSALQDAIQKGTGQRAKKLGRKDLSGKTGTTNDWMDAWYSGFNPDVVATAFVGFDNPRSLKEYGAMAALPMWMYFMEAALKDKPDNVQTPPEGIVSMKIDPRTGLLASEDHPEPIYEFFSINNSPTINSSGDPGEGGVGNSSVESLF